MRRRELLAGTGAAVALAGCDGAVSRLARLAGGDLPEHVAVPDGARVTTARRLLDRAAFGPALGDLERAEAMGTDAWIEEQLAPGSLDDTEADIRTAFIDAVNAPSDLAFEIRPEEVQEQLVAHTLLRAVYSKRQLEETLVSFFLDHFHVAIGKSLCRHLEVIHVRDVIRPRVLGPFRELLAAVVLSPAMLVYLDGRDNAVEEPGDVPNENHARELLELHALGVDGGYTQADVMEAARCLTGWTVEESRAPGTVLFVPARHDPGRKHVLGSRIPSGGGERDLDRLLDAVLAHPATSRHLARELARFYVADEPPPALVERAAATFRRTDGSIRDVVATILRADELVASPPRIKRPFSFVVSSLRGLGADTHARGALQTHLRAMGHAPFEHPTPDGYPRRGDAWLGTMLARFRFALALSDGTLDDTDIDASALRARIDDPGGGHLAATRSDPPLRHSTPDHRLFAHLVGRAPTPKERAALDLHRARASEAADARSLALIVSSPAFSTC